jgi:hypothetical protein
VKAVGKVLDTGVLVSYARGDTYADAVLAVAHRKLIPLAVPAACFAEAIAEVDPKEGARVLSIREMPVVETVAFDDRSVVQAGVLMADASWPDAPMAAAFAAYEGRSRSWPVLTSRPETIARLGGEAEQI